IIVREASAGPSQYWNVQLAQVRDRFLAVAVDIRNRRILAHPQSSVHAGSEVLGEVAVNFRADQSDFGVSTHHDPFGPGRGAARRGSWRGKRTHCGVWGEAPARVFPWHTAHLNGLAGWIVIGGNSRPENLDKRHSGCTRASAGRRAGFLNHAEV